MQRPGITLIELLAVIAIIAILASSEVAQWRTRF
jgi:prepilin-type N-terminal cleavage/methylation domain-containing protein